MLKRLCLVLALVMLAMPISACRFIAPALEDIGGYGACNDGCTTKTDLIVRQWARDARRGEEFGDTYFLNYDRNDPYRGDFYVLDGSGCCSR